jgi:SAM-dependent methyltransferase
VEESVLPLISCLPAVEKALSYVLDGGVKSVLDVGCGKGLSGYLLKSYTGAEWIVGLDVYEPYLELCRKQGNYDVLKCWNLLDLPLPFGSGSFDLAVCFDVIEHLAKADGVKLLKELQRVSNRVLVSTPAIFSNEHGSVDENVYQNHLCLWRKKDFTILGFSVFGGGRFMVKGRLVRYVSWLLEPLTFLFPDYGCWFVAEWVNPVGCVGCRQKEAFTNYNSVTAISRAKTGVSK